MDKKKTNKRKKGKAARQRQRMIIGSTIAVVLIVVIVIGVFVLGSCSVNGSDTNTVQLLEDGKVISTSVESFDGNTYSKNDLKSYIKDVINTYNAEHQNAVKQKSLRVKDGKAVLVMEYASADVFEDFEGTDMFVGSLADAVAAGYTFEGTFANVAGGKVMACSTDDFMNDSEYKVLIIKANSNVSLEEGQICYVSSENTESVKDGVVVIKDGANILANVALEDTESTEAAVEVEGAISDEELLLGADEGIDFDFGEDEEETNQYSNVYTYIIYK